MRTLFLWAALATASTAWAGPTRAIQKAATAADVAKMVSGLKHKKGFVRELSARSLARVSPDADAEALLTTCIQSETEFGYVRAACAHTLAMWKVSGADALIIEAMDQVDPESRYWMAAALSRLNTREARAHIVSLTSDTDLFLAASAREWSR